MMRLCWLASSAYSDSVLLALNPRSRSTGNPKAPRMALNSDRLTDQSSGNPTHKSQSPKAISSLSGSISDRSHVADPSGVNSLMTGNVSLISSCCAKRPFFSILSCCSLVINFLIGGKLKSKMLENQAPHSHTKRSSGQESANSAHQWSAVLVNSVLDGCGFVYAWRGLVSYPS